VDNKKKRLFLLLICTYIVILFIVGLWPLNFWQKNQVSLNERDGLTLLPPSAVYTPQPSPKLMNLQEFTILMHVSSNISEPRGYGSILMCALDYDHMNFMVGQWRKGLELRIRSANGPRTISFGKKDVFKKAGPAWFAIVYDGNRLILYQNGKIVATRRVGRLIFSNWNRSYPVVIGSDAHGRGFWEGRIGSIAIFDRALSKSAIENVPLMIGDFTPLIFYSFCESSGTAVTDRGTGVPANLSIPSRFTPYKRSILAHPYNDLKSYRRDFGDILINLVGFVPLGFLLTLRLMGSGGSLKKSLLMSIFVGFTISFAIEAAQGFLWSRSSSMIDLINNTFGCAAGVLIYHFRGIFSLVPETIPYQEHQ
jgi:VanZ family protein